MKNSNPASVFRSQAPEVLAAWAEWCERVSATAARQQVLLDRFPGYEIVHTQTRVIGLHGDQCPGEGWRRDREGWWVPRLSSKAGKALASELAACSKGSPSIPGCPPVVWPGLCAYWPGMTQLGDFIYVGWGCTEGEAIECGMDIARWEPVRLSEYYAVLENEEASND